MASQTDSNDFAAHQQGFAQFIAMVKFSVAATAFGVIALYFFIITGNFWAGLFFLVISVPVGFWAGGFGRSSRARA
jgi:hypothetical protein